MCDFIADILFIWMIVVSAQHPPPPEADKAKGRIGIAKIVPRRLMRKPDRSSAVGERQPGEVRPETRYLHLLTTYNVPWDVTKTARDVWQNFFDGESGTLDGVESKRAGVNIGIRGSAEYDYSHLLHMGGGSKSVDDPTTVGGHREGAKIAALVMLTKMGAKRVVHESGNWRLTYYLDDVDDYKEGGKPARGLYAKVEEGKAEPGSRFYAEFADPRVAEDFLAARDLFYHKDNPDFQEPTYVNPGMGGFKIHVGKRGNLYEGGQRRDYQDYGAARGESYAVEDVTLWTKGKVFEPDRDRGAVNHAQVKERIIDNIAWSMTPEEIRSVISQNPDLWHKTESFGLGEELLRQMAVTYEIKHNGERIDFPPMFVASDAHLLNFEDELKHAGYTICDFSMERFGMQTASEAFKKMSEHLRTEPSEAEQERINILQEFTSDILKINSPQIWLFSKKNEKSIIHGQHTPEFLWVSQEALHGDFADALETYIHEISHELGHGHDAEFAYTLDMHLAAAMKVLTEAITNPANEVSRRVSVALKKWEEIKDRLAKVEQEADTSEVGTGEAAVNESSAD